MGVDSMDFAGFQAVARKPARFGYCVCVEGIQIVSFKIYIDAIILVTILLLRKNSLIYLETA